MRMAILYLVAFISIVTAFLSLQSLNSEKNKNNDLTINTQQLNKHIKELQREIALLKKEKETLSKSLSSIENVLSSKVKNNKNQERLTPEKSQHSKGTANSSLIDIEEYKKLQETIALSVSLNTNDLVAHMDEKFSQEQTDNNWAKDIENNLNTIINSAEKFSDYAFLNTKCKSSLCRISVYVNDIEQANQVMKKVTDAINQQESDIRYSQLIATPDINNNKTYIYLVRKS